MTSLLSCFFYRRATNAPPFFEILFDWFFVLFRFNPSPGGKGWARASGAHAEGQKITRVSIRLLRLFALMTGFCHFITFFPPWQAGIQRLSVRFRNGKDGHFRSLAGMATPHRARNALRVGGLLKPLRSAFHVTDVVGRALFSDPPVAPEPNAGVVHKRARNCGPGERYWRRGQGVVVAYERAAGSRGKPRKRVYGRGGLFWHEGKY